MYTRVKERHKARQAALRAKSGDSRSEGESEEEDEEGEDDDDDDDDEGEEEEGAERGDEDDGQENRRVLRTRNRNTKASGGSGGGSGKFPAEKKSYSFRTKRAPTQFYQEPAHESRPRTRRDDYGAPVSSLTKE